MEVMLEQLGTSVGKSFLEQGKSLLDMVLLKSSCHLGGVRPGFHSCRVGHLRGGRCRSTSKKGSSRRGMGQVPMGQMPGKIHRRRTGQLPDKVCLRNDG